ncbi:hypothetical protein IWQ60_002957 [Tieghemiomyces parasiticus]|uniref:Uncharacterized protein n=1 Tax=Tieghemiomyces parasiticus TaxID=78921 RepID=A0A9W8AB68_9FUNG|nr:hypothetical protein IWQ60_002957 [Tieghemiomyces parasiticus]
MELHETARIYLLPRKRGPLFAQGSMRDHLQKVLDDEFPHRCLMTLENSVRPLPLTTVAGDHTGAGSDSGDSDNATGGCGQASKRKAAGNPPTARQPRRFCAAQRVPFAALGWAHYRSAPGNTTTYGTLLAVDQRGDIWAFDWDHNSYKLVARTGVTATVVGRTAPDNVRYVIGLANRSLKVYKPASPEDIVIWDADTWCKLHVLPAHPSKILQAGYSPCGRHIVACFSTDTIVLWDAETFAKVWKVKAPPRNPHHATDADRAALYEADASAVAPRLTTFAVDDRGTMMIAGGRTVSLWVWDLQVQCLTQEFTTPVLGDGVAQLDFIRGTQIVLVVTMAGRVYLLNIDDARFVHVGFTFAIDRTPVAGPPAVTLGQPSAAYLAQIEREEAELIRTK